MCPHAAMYVSSYCYICVLIQGAHSTLLKTYPTILLYICVLMLLYVCPHTGRAFNAIENLPVRKIEVLRACILEIG
jgi:hypothetical protein